MSIQMRDGRSEKNDEDNDDNADHMLIILL